MRNTTIQRPNHLRQVPTKTLMLGLVCTLPLCSTARGNEPDFLDPLVVIGTKISDFSPYSAGRLAGAYDAITREYLIYEQPDDTLELFSKLPGVTISRFNQGIVNTDISIRGFAGDGTSPHAKLLIDGIPSNLHNGYNELDQMFPMAMEGIEIFKGTGDVRYGLYNIAGNYNVASRTDIARELQLTYGSFDAREIQGYWGLKTGNLTQNYFFGYRNANGYRDHSNVEKHTISGRWNYEFDQETHLTFIARNSQYEGDSPGYLTRQQSRDTPRSSASYANQDGGEKNVDHYSLHFDKSFLDDSVQLDVKAYHQTFERDRWVRFSQAGSLGNRYDDQTMQGVITTLGWTLNEKWKIESGLDYEHQDVLEQRYGSIGQQRVRGAIARNNDHSLEILGGYLTVENSPFEWLRWNAGVRLDQLDGDFKSTTAAGVVTDRDIFDFGTIVQPKSNIFITHNENFVTFANVGRSFQHPFGADLYTTGNTSARDVSINDGWEIGEKWQPTDAISLRLSYWQQRAKDEFVNIDGTNQNVGETKREGIDFVADWKATETLTFWGNYSHNLSEISKPASALATTAGNNLRGVPDYVYSVGATYKITEDLSARIHIDGQGSYYLNEQNAGGKFGGYTLVNAGVDYEKSWGRISLQVNNLLDRQYEYAFDLSAAGDASDTIHSPGDGVNASLSYTYSF